MTFLDRKFPNETRDNLKHLSSFSIRRIDAGRSLNVDHMKCVVNSDGARANDNPVNTYDWDNLFKVHEFCWNKGCSIDHQSQVKMSFNLDNLEVDYLRRLNELR